MKKNIFIIIMVLIFCCIATSQQLTSQQLTSQQDSLQDSLYKFKVDTKSKLFKEVLNKLNLKRPAQINFKQTKKIKAINTPLISSGTISVSNKNIICWKTQVPFKSAMIISNEGIKKKVGDNKITFEKAADKKEIAFFVKMMLALFNADEKSLKSEFKIFFTTNSDKWYIGLKPKNRKLARFLKNITLIGSETLEHIIIAEQSGDISDIQISSVNTESQAANIRCLN